MHELALTRSIFQITDRAAAGRVVSAIYLDMGVLRQVVPDALGFTWERMGRQSENLARSKLRINLVSTVITCGECGTDTPIDGNLIFTCTTRNSTRYHVKTREEFIPTEMDVS